MFALAPGGEWVADGTDSEGGVGVGLGTTMPVGTVAVIVGLTFDVCMALGVGVGSSRGILTGLASPVGLRSSGASEIGVEIVRDVASLQPTLNTNAAPRHALMSRRRNNGPGLVCFINPCHRHFDLPRFQHSRSWVGI